MFGSLMAGSVIIPGAFIGIITGGYMMKKLKLDIVGMTKLLLLTNVIPTCAIITLLFLGCKNIDLVGITAAYPSR